jgi:twitching motility protein PilT
MARLDAFIELLHQRGADALVMQTGSAAMLEGPGPSSQAIIKRMLTSQQIVSAVAELLPPYAAEGFDGSQDEEAVYVSPAGRVLVRFMRNATGVRAEVRPESGPPQKEDPPSAGQPEPAANVHALHAVKAPRPAEAPPPASPDAGLRSIAVPPRSADPAEAIASLLELCNEHRASDLHLTSGSAPALRLDGDILRLEGWGAPSADELQELLWSIAPKANREQWLAVKDTDFAHETPEARWRVNIFCERLGIGAVLRRIPSNILSAEQMGIPKTVLDLCFLPKGLVLVTGPTGSGKSTTLAAMIDYINRNRDDHVITIEDPIEFVHPHKRCLMHQREVGVHTSSFKAALRAALREDPDVVLVGEMRDLETIAIALETAETGHLVFGTLHTNTAPSAVDRIIDQFPADRQSQVRTMLSESLKCVVTQTLCKKVGGGRVPAMEILVVNGAVSNLIREGKTFQIPSVMQTGRAHGMQLLNDALLELVRKKLVTPKDALAKAVAKAELRKMLEAGGTSPAEMEA